MKEYYRVEADIDLDAICENIRQIRSIIKTDTKIMGIVKADGYGHGAIPIARALDGLVDEYGVAILEEGLELRRAGIQKPILILGYTPKEQLKDMIAYDIMSTVFQYETAKRISKEAVRQGKLAKIHIKLDTGMGRIGFLNEKESVEAILKISQLPGIKIEGIFSHFSKSDEKDKTYAKKQLEIFLKVIAQLEQEGLTIPTKHISNSAAIIDMPEANLDMVRSGIATYGLYPSDEVDQNRLKLRPSMQVKAHVIYVKTVEPGTLIGYNGTFEAKRKTTVATVPVGYADGYARALSNQGRVLIHGTFAPIIGKICMDQFMVDVTDIGGVKQGDVVTLVGVDGENFISLEEIGAIAHSFHYEAACDFGKRIPRVYYFNGKKVGTCDFYDSAIASFDLML
ncbi:MAG: alanine racemase [Clostridiales bacterium]|nr:alanine racemase [Clostridiales bacterium]